MRIVHVASEVAPFSKTGGLADVTGSLPAALAASGADVTVISPLYPSVGKTGQELQFCAETEIHNGSSICKARLLGSSNSAVRHIFVDYPDYFNRAGLYGETGQDYPDNAQRYLLLCRAALAANSLLKLDAEIVHCHDWQTGLLPLIIRQSARQDNASGFISSPEHIRTAVPSTVFTIHNLGYQGNFPSSVFDELSLPAEHWSPDSLEYHNQVSYLKAGIIHADRLTTVSPTYAREIQQPELGFGMDSILRARADNLTGILNGIDTDYWNPQTDRHLVSNYSVDQMEGKAANARSLSKELGLASDGPLFAMVSRLAGQKGINMVIAEIPHLVSRGARVCILGTGQPEYHRALEELVRQCPGSVAVVLSFDEALAHRIYAAADFFMMPSEYEPCGLGQMIALRYGTLPVAAKTGGLTDTVFENGRPDSNGFLFKPKDQSGFAAALGRALTFHSHPEELAEIRRNGMLTDFSWKARAEDYLDLYQALTN